MRALVYAAFGAAPQILDVPDPICPDDGVVIRVEATGLCRSDWHGWMGHDPSITVPHVPGHEFAGTISAIGTEVRGWRIGDRVTAPFVCACGVCPQCVVGDHQVCDAQEQPGFTYWGSFAELVMVPHAEINLILLPDGLGSVEAASLGCRFATAYRAIVFQGRLAAGDWLAVHGCGGVGLSAVMIAVAKGARVIAIDPSEAACRAALELGAEVALRGVSQDVVAEVHELTLGGAHVSIDAFGSVPTCVNSIRSLRKRGRHIQVGLMLAGDSAPAVPMDLVVAHELEIRGSHGMAAHDYRTMLAEIAAGTLDPARLVDRTVSLHDAPAALMAMDRPTVAPGMTIIRPAAQETL